MHGLFYDNAVFPSVESDPGPMLDHSETDHGIKVPGPLLVAG